MAGEETMLKKFCAKIWVSSLFGFFKELCNVFSPPHHYHMVICCLMAPNCFCRFFLRETYTGHCHTAQSIPLCS